MDELIASADAADALYDWAWLKFDRSVRSLPNCEHTEAWGAYNAECRKMQMCGTRLKDAALLRREDMPRGTTTIQEQVRVAATSQMDTEAFVMHFNRRHKRSLSGMDSLPEDIEFNIEQLYRSFHRRLHETLIGFKHKHDPDPPEDSVDRAIECLIENRNFGWKELAGIEGLVAVFPDGQIATRINGVVKHHRSIEDATDRLIGSTTPVKAKR